MLDDQIKSCCEYQSCSKKKKITLCIPPKYCWIFGYELLQVGNLSYAKHTLRRCPTLLQRRVTVAKQPTIIERHPLSFTEHVGSNISRPWTLSIFHATLADTEAERGLKSFRKHPIHNSQARFNRLSTAGIPSCISFLSTAQYQLEACFFAPRLWHPKHRRRACHFVCLRCSKAPWTNGTTHTAVGVAVCSCLASVEAGDCCHLLIYRWSAAIWLSWR